MGQLLTLMVFGDVITVDNDDDIEDGEMNGAPISGPPGLETRDPEVSCGRSDAAANGGPHGTDSGADAAESEPCGSSPATASVRPYPLSGLRISRPGGPDIEAPFISPSSMSSSLLTVMASPNTISVKSCPMSTIAQGWLITTLLCNF